MVSRLAPFQTCFCAEAFGTRYRVPWKPDCRRAWQTIFRRIDARRHRHQQPISAHDRTAGLRRKGCGQSPLRIVQGNPRGAFRRASRHYSRSPDGYVAWSTDEAEIWQRCNRCARSWSVRPLRTAFGFTRIRKWGRMSTSGNTILITGGTSGIGLELATRLRQMGNTVIVTGKDPAKD